MAAARATTSVSIDWADHHRVDALKTVVLTPSTVDLPPELSASDLQAAAQHAADRWSYPNVPCGVQLTVAEPRAVRLAAQDGTNAIIHRASSWCHNNRCGPETTFPFRATGMTTAYPRGAAGAAVQEADVELNGVAFQLTSVAGGGEGQGGDAGAGAARARWSVPLEPVLVHEIGHVLGLPDACLAGHRASGRPVVAECSSDERARAMFPTGLHATVAPADVAELCRLYPPEARGFPLTAAFAAAAALLALAFATVAITRRRRLMSSRRPASPPKRG